jgi:hypothetical protein
MSRPPSVLLWLQRSPRRTAGAAQPRLRPAPGHRRGAVRRFLARQWHLYQLMYLPPLAEEPFPWEAGFLRWSGDRLDGAVLPLVQQRDPGP